MTLRAIWLIATLCILAVVLFWALSTVTTVITGVVIRQDENPRGRTPIADVALGVANDPTHRVWKTDSSGFFKVALSSRGRGKKAILLTFQHPDYLATRKQVTSEGGLYVVRLIPAKRLDELKQPARIANVTIRYSTTITRLLKIGSAVKMIEVVNRGNVPCDAGGPCSPDRKWKAAEGTLLLSAGAGNEFENVRAVCIAGPCPFTDTRTLPNRKRDEIAVTARTWSETATFLLEAEVVRSMEEVVLIVSYPPVFGRYFNFSLPPNADAVTIQADINGETILFPLGPLTSFSWASCDSRVSEDRAMIYQCEIKDGYTLQ